MYDVTQNHGEPPSESEKPSEIMEALSGDDSPGDRLERLIDRVLPSESSRGRGRVFRAIQQTVSGGRWTDVSSKTGLTLLRLNVLLGHNPAFRELWIAAREAGDDARKQRRQDIADKRAVEGWSEAVWYKGERCGTLKRFDNRLLEFLLEADDPGKYRKGTEGVKVNVQVAQIMDALKGSGVSSLVNSGAPRLAPDRADAPPAPEPRENPNESHES